MIRETGEALLRLENVSRTYVQGEETAAALRNVTLSVSAGEFVAIAGPSGSGKTTLLNLCAGLDQPTGGTVWLGGRNLAKLTPRDLADLRLREVGFIFQSYNLVPVLSVEENAEFVLLLQGAPEAVRKPRVRSLLQHLGLERLASRRPGQLSGGQQQRVAVARAVAARPRLVLADEPTANLDTATALELLNLMERLNREDCVTFLFSTHDPRVMSRAHRIIHVVDGGIERDERVNGHAPGRQPDAPG